MSSIKEWLRISILLCTFGFFREMRPSEPFVFEFLSGEWRNITLEQVNRDIYPAGTYFYLAQLVIVFLVTDILRYKPIIVFSALAGIVLWGLLLWTKTLPELIVAQFFFGIFMAAEVAYYTYIYAKVDREKYQIVTGHTRSAILIGKFLAGVLAQILVSFDLLDLRELNFISFGSQIASLVFALMLPSVNASLYFYTLSTTSDSPPSPLSSADHKNPSAIQLHRSHSSSLNGAVMDNSDTSNESKMTKKGQSPANSPQLVDPSRLTDAKPTLHHHHHAEMTHVDGGRREGGERQGEGSTLGSGGGQFDSNLQPQFSWRRAYQLLWQHFVQAYTSSVVLQWSLWWALAMGGYLQIVSYVQLLYKEIDPNNENFYNGGVEAAMTLFSALGAFMAGFLDSQQYRKWDLVILTVCSVIEGVLIVVSAATTSVWVAYVAYVLFGVLYNFMVTVASATVAKKIHEDSFALIFGINTVVALIAQTILTIAIVSDDGFALSPRGQFYAFGGYFLALSVIYALTGVVQYVKRRKRGNDSK